jgi:DNA repair protein RecO (recombination protein O)
MIRKIEGIIIKTIAYSDSSKILTILTSDLGKVGVIAKGAKRMTSKLRSTTQLFTYGEFYIYHKPKGLSTLSQVDVKSMYPKMTHDLIKHAYASVIIELTDRINHEPSQNHYVYNILLKSLELIEEGMDPEVVLFIFELKATQLLGFGLNLDECVICGSTKNIVSISTSYGGLICQKCLANNHPPINGQYLQLLRKLYYIELNQINSISLKPKTKTVIRKIIDEYYDIHSGIYIKSKRYLRDLKNLSNQIGR